MRIDLYTKVCLTVIALSLGSIALKDTSVIKQSWASSNVVQKVALCSVDGSKCSTFTNSERFRVNAP